MNQPTYEQLQAQLEAFKESNENWKEGFETTKRNLDEADKRIEELHKQRDELLSALFNAKETIKIWHGNEAWEIYDKHSPEMKQINAAIAKVSK